MNKESLNIFYEIECLSEHSKILSIQDLYKTWPKTIDKRNGLPYLQKLIKYNEELFDFLGIQATIVGTDSKIGLQFCTSQYVGAIPMLSPITGLQTGDFIVKPRFTGADIHSNYIELLEILGDAIDPEFYNSILLKSGRNFRPPIYLEALKFINALETVVKGNWQKFQNKEKNDSRPLGTVNWHKYALKSHKVEQALSYPVRKNILNEYHEEYSNIRYVFNLCRNEVLAAKTPHNIKLAVKNKIDYINYRLAHHKPKPIISFRFNSHDKPIIKDLKNIANDFLSYNINDCQAWRLDYNIVFERLVQYIFYKVAKMTGGITTPNPRINNKSFTKTSWELKHLEPDLLYKRDNNVIIIDAKYKSHLYNKYSLSENLKTEFRKDLHQLMSYMSFQDAPEKIGFLCYPSNKYELSESTYTTQFNNCKNRIFILGIPLNKSEIDNIIKNLRIKLDNI